MISVILATKNRPEKIVTCIQSILDNKKIKFELIIVDQSTNFKTRDIVTRYNSKTIRYYRMNQSGKAKALNFAIKKSRGTLLAFTDDDCVVAKNWLKQISTSYHLYPQISGVFGNTHPYLKTKTKGKCSVATFVSDTYRFYTTPNIIHYNVLGQGNNMSIKKSAILSAGIFKEWLGVGSAAKAGEESELIFRLLMKKRMLMTNPNMVVYHNRWLTKNEYQLQEHAYSRGLFAFYSYYLFSPSGKIMTSLLQHRFYERFKITLRVFKHTTSMSNLIHVCYLGIHELVNIFIGTLIGLVHDVYHNL